MVMTPRLCYFICCTHRSGSYLLAEALINTGLAGQPAEHIKTYIDPWNARFTLADYRAALQPIFDKGTVDGIFGTKVMWPWFSDTMAKLETLAPREGKTVAELFSLLFPNLRYIMLTRRDKVRQMVSLGRARWTNEWRSTQMQGKRGDVKDLRLDPAVVDSQIQGTRQIEASFQRYFATNGIRAFPVVYENLVARYEGTALDVLDFLGISHPPDLEFGPRVLQKQADEASDELVRQYYASKGISPAM